MSNSLYLLPGCSSNSDCSALTICNINSGSCEPKTCNEMRQKPGCHVSGPDRITVGTDVTLQCEAGLVYIDDNGQASKSTQVQCIDTDPMPRLMGKDRVRLGKCEPGWINFKSL